MLLDDGRCTENMSNVWRLQQLVAQFNRAMDAEFIRAMDELPNASREKTQHYEDAMRSYAAQKGACVARLAQLGVN